MTTIHYYSIVVTIILFLILLNFISGVILKYKDKKEIDKKNESISKLEVFMKDDFPNIYRQYKRTILDIMREDYHRYNTKEEFIIDVNGMISESIQHDMINNKIGYEIEDDILMGITDELLKQYIMTDLIEDRDISLLFTLNKNKDVFTKEQKIVKNDNYLSDISNDLNMIINEDDYI